MAKKKMTLEEKLEEAIVKDIPYEVPKNWVWSKLEAISIIISKGTTPKGGKLAYVDKGVNFLRVENIDKYGYISLDNIKYIDEDVHFGFLKRSILMENDILISIAGTLGKTAIVRKIDLPINTNQAIAFVRLKNIKKTLPKYVKLFLASPETTKELLSKTKVTAIPNLTLEIISKCEIPLPPLKEQQRIVDKIESLFEKLDKAKELIEDARDDFEMRKFSIIYKGISGDLTGNKSKLKTKNSIRIPDTWKWIEFKKLGKLERGRSKHRPRNDQRLFGGEYPFIQTGDIANSDVYVIEHKQTLSEFGLNQSRLFKKGTLCITIAANIGDVAILTYDCCFPDSIVGFTPNEHVDSKYIYYFLTLIKRDLEHFAPATAQKNINLKILGDVEIPIPSLEEQKEIVRILDKALEKEAKVEELTTLEGQIELIKKSILAKAFRGQLGTNSEEDESALELLKEILNKE